MIEGVLASLRWPVTRLIDPARFDEGIRDLYRTAEMTSGVFCYTFFKAVAVAPPSW